MARAMVGLRAEGLGYLSKQYRAEPLISGRNSYMFISLDVGGEHAGSTADRSPIQARGGARRRGGGDPRPGRCGSDWDCALGTALSQAPSSRAFSADASDSTTFKQLFPDYLRRTREEDAMVARQNRQAHTPACNDNGPVLILCRATPEPRSPILRVASLLAGVVSVSYMAEGVLLIAPSKTPVRSVPARVARASSASQDT